MTTSSEHTHDSTPTLVVLHPHRGDHDLVIRAIARHRSAKANGDAHGAQAALLEAQRALEAHLAEIRSAARR